MRKTIVAAAAAFAVASGAMTIQASAADLDFIQPAPPPLVPTWSGFYVGGHIGFGEADADFEQDVDLFDLQGLEISSDSFSSSASPDGLVGGVQGGYNFQSGPLVFGIEGDISFTDWSESSLLFDTDEGDLGGPFDGVSAFGTSSIDIDFLASVRGRVGYAFDSLLLYGTGGVAWADAEVRARMAAVDDAGDIIDERTAKADLDDIGFVVGGGLAWMVLPQTMSLGVEGLYYFFDDEETLIDETVEHELGEADIRATAALDDAWVIRARADFHF